MKNWHLTMLFKVALILTIAIAGFGQAVHQLWNWLVPGIFGLQAITFWQAVGLLSLSWILFGGWRGFRGPGPGSRRAMRERRFREGVRERCETA